MLVVESVTGGSPTETLDIRVDDRLLAYDGRRLLSPAFLLALEENTSGPQTAVLRIARDGIERDLAILTGKLGLIARPELPDDVLLDYDNGRAAFEDEQFAEAAHRWRVAAERAHEKSVSAWLHTKAGEAWEKAPDWQQAREAYTAAWEQLQGEEDTAEQSQTAMALGKCWQSLNDYEAAVQWYTQAQQLDEIAERPLWVASALDSLRAIALLRGDSQAAQDYFTRAQQIRDRARMDAPRIVDDEVQFTVYRPKAVVTGKWYSLLAFAHLAQLPGDAEADAPDPMQEMVRQASNVLGADAPAYRDTTADSTRSVPRGDEITFIPEIEGFEFNPPRHTIRWVEQVHRAEFRMRTLTGNVGTVARGRISVFVGAILAADIPVSIHIESETSPATRALPLERTTATRYRRVFASYSHKDAGIVDQFDHFVKAFGDDYLRDTRNLRAGEVWNAQLRTLIDSADVFQLFWSSNSMISPYVRQEWEHALSLQRPGFVRPVYWEPTFPEKPPDLPSPELRCLHFHRLPVEAVSLTTRMPSADVEIREPSAETSQPSDSPLQVESVSASLVSENVMGERRKRSDVRTLEQVLDTYAEAEYLLGEDTDLEKADHHIAVFRGDLHELVKRNRSAFNLSLALMVVLFLLDVTLTLIRPQDPMWVKSVVIGAFGIIACGLIARMIARWRETSRTELLLVLADGADPKIVQQIINKLAEKL